MKKSTGNFSYIYSGTCLIRHALGEKFCVGIGRLSDYTITVKNIENGQKGMKVNVR